MFVFATTNNFRAVVVVVVVVVAPVDFRAPCAFPQHAPRRFSRPPRLLQHLEYYGGNLDCVGKNYVGTQNFLKSFLELPESEVDERLGLLLTLPLLRIADKSWRTLSCSQDCGLET